MATSLLTPEQQVAIADAAFLRRLAGEFKDRARQYRADSKPNAAQVCDDRHDRLLLMAERIEVTAGIPIDLDV